MNGYVGDMMNHLLCGVRARHWLKFLQALQDTTAEVEIERAVAGISEEIAEAEPAPTENSALLILLEQVRKLAGLAD